MSRTPSNTPRQTDGQLGLWDAVSIIVGIVIGTTIFYVPWLIIANVPDPWSGLGVWVFGGLLALVGALCYAELATAYPRSGGDYEYLSRAFGPWLGFLFGWTQLAVLLTASIGTMAVVFADFATSFRKFEDIYDTGLPSSLVYAAVAVIVLTLINVLGVTAGKWTQNLLSLTKVVGLGAILVAGFGFGVVWSQPELWWPTTPPRQFDGSPVPWPWGSLAIILVLYAYGGWNDAAFVAAEVKERQRNLPLALVLGVGLIVVIYLLVNAAYIAGVGFDAARLPPDPDKGIPRLPVRVLQRSPLGEAGGQVLSILIMISALGAVNALIFAGARVYATMGADHRLFGFLGHWKPGRGAPVLAMLVQAILTLIMIAILGTRDGHELVNQGLDLIGLSPENRNWAPYEAFDSIVSHTAPVFWTFFLLTGVALFVLRQNDPQRERPFKVPFYPELPLIFCGMCVYMLYQSLAYIGVRCVFGFALVALGLPLYRLSQWLGPKR